MALYSEVYIPMFDPLSQEALRDPHQLYDRIRTEMPVHFDARLHSWIIVRHRDARRILGDHCTFTADFRKAGEVIPNEAMSIQLLDPPDHGIIHQALAQGYRAQDWKGLRNGLNKEIGCRIEEASREDAVEFIGAVAAPVAFHAITSLLGFSGLDRDDLHECSTATVNPMDPGLNLAAAAPGAVARVRLNELVIQEYQSNRRIGLIGWMRQHASGVVATPIIVNTLRAMLDAGYAPVVKLLGNALNAVLVSPSTNLARIQSGSYRHWTREVLRYATPVHAVSRVCTTETDVDGQQIQPNQDVVVLLAAANRDPAVFAEPHVLQLDRDASAALTFGFGPHFCPGASLATLVLELGLSYIAARFPQTLLMAEPEPLPNAVLRGPASLLVGLKG